MRSSSGIGCGSKDALPFRGPSCPPTTAATSSPKIYEDEFALAFENVHPLTPVHVLVVPKGEYASHADFSVLAPPALIVGFWRAVGHTATKLGLEERGYRIVANHGPDANQIVFHFHVHILGGRRLSSISGTGLGDGT